MERRILKDFQIGLVEGIVADVLVKAHEPKDVFSQIAKAIGTRASSKSKNWNEIVRKNTVIRNPIGSTQASIHRKNRRSLRRHIIDASQKGLEMNTDKLIEYNPMLSEVSQTTRVAYVKFMSKKLKKDDHLDKIFLENEEMERKKSEDTADGGSTSTVAFDTLVKKASIVRRQSEEQMEATAKASSSSPTPETVAEEVKDPAAEQDPKALDAPDVKDFRCRTPIPEDPNEDVVMSPDVQKKRSSLTVSLSSTTTSPPLIAEPRPPTPIPSPLAEPKVVGPETVVTEKKDSLKPEAAKEGSSSRPVTPKIIITPKKGKSAVSGRTLDGWI